MTGFTRNIALAAVVITAIGAGLSAQARAGDASDLAKIAVGAIALGVLADKLNDDAARHPATSRKYVRTHKYKAPYRHKRKGIQRKRLHSAGPRHHGGFHRHGDFGHSHSYTGVHSH